MAFGSLIAMPPVAAGADGPRERRDTVVATLGVGTSEAPNEGRAVPLGTCRTTKATRVGI